MAKVDIYTREFCPFCVRALKLLDSKGVSYTHIDAGMDPDKRKEMIQRANGGSTYPQIFVGDIHIGGCDDMFALERAGKLDALLSQD
jgi:Glutaredoxin, GrxC family